MRERLPRALFLKSIWPGLGGGLLMTKWYAGILWSGGDRDESDFRGVLFVLYPTRVQNLRVGGTNPTCGNDVASL